MKLKKGDSIQTTIVDMAFGGVGLGKVGLAEGELVVFVEGTVAGDTVEARLFKVKKKYAEARLEKIIAPSPERITARCKHFGYCGGCTLQFLDYKNQLKWKEKMVGDSLRQIGGFKEVTVEPIIGCESPWFYRNKMEYSFGSPLTLGLHPRKNFREVFPLEECFLESPESAKIAIGVRQWAAAHELTGFDPRTHEGVLRTLTVREGKNTGEMMVNLITSTRDFSFEKEFVAFIKEHFPFVTSLYRTGVTVRKGYRTVMEEHLLSGKKNLREILTVEVDGRKLTLDFEILPQAFFQPNTKQAQILYQKVLACAAATPGDSVLDLFCGTGTIGMFFAKSGVKVTGIDLVPDAIENAKNNAAHNDIKNIEFLCGDVGTMLEKFKITPSILVTDPPRAGITTKSLEKIIALKIPKWVYVSCNPTTLARDLQSICAAGYEIEKVQPVDMFPQTYHVETVCFLRLKQ